MKNSAYKIFKNTVPVQELFERFKDDSAPFLLESSQDVAGMGRYSFFGSEPFLTITCKNAKCFIERNGKTEQRQQPGLSVLREFLNVYCLEGAEKMRLPFLSGAVGFFAYDLGFSLEKIKRSNRPDAIVPDLMFAFYDAVICVDHKKDEVIVFSTGFPEKSRLRKKKAEGRLVEISEKLRPQEGTQNLHQERIKKGDLTSNFSRREYLVAVSKAKSHIAAGDIYQVNLSQKFKTRLAIDDWELYRRLLKNFPVSFSGFLKNDDFAIISASPERFLKFDGRRVFTRPMKGTRKRTGDPALNKKLKRELELSKKEKAELLMIVDLERNDLGRVCDYGSVKVRRLRQIEVYRSVFQATAEIEGVLHKNKDRLDLIKACFPGGSVTGCPKIRAMEIIEELEPSSRSVYTGALGYFSFHNTLEFNILIRSFLKKKDEVSFSVGGGIVSDSKPADEYEETLVKGKALMEALTNVR
ncbi:MAG: anthranilate synthase component I family protein [Candidatus Omnitrophica bacterium]|nr:anthranilate synthase component I family protein [Candidatus Omnitrophota bacterium]